MKRQAVQLSVILAVSVLCHVLLDAGYLRTALSVAYVFGLLMGANSCKRP